MSKQFLKSIFFNLVCKQEVCLIQYIDDKCIEQFHSLDEFYKNALFKKITIVKNGVVWNKFITSAIMNTEERILKIDSTTNLNLHGVCKVDGLSH